MYESTAVPRADLIQLLLDARPVDIIVFQAHPGIAPQSMFELVEKIGTWTQFECSDPALESTEILHVPTAKQTVASCPAHQSGSSLPWLSLLPQAHGSRHCCTMHSSTRIDWVKFCQVDPRETLAAWSSICSRGGWSSPIAASCCAC